MKYTYIKRGIISLLVVTSISTATCYANVSPRTEVMIERGLANYEKIITIENENTSLEELVDVIQSKKIYNISSFKMNSSGKSINLYPEYYETKDDMNKVKLVANLIKEETYGMSDIEKVYHITQRITELMKYDSTDENNFRIYSPTTILKEGSAVCQAYARLADMLFEHVDLDTELVEGKLSNVPHLWNAVKLNDAWYSVDVTSADNDEDGKVNFQFVLMDSEDLSEYNYTVTFTPVKLTKTDIKLFKDSGLFSSKNKEFYTLSSTKVLIGYNYIIKTLNVKNIAEDFWVVGGELFIKNDNAVTNKNNNLIYYNNLNSNDVITLKNGGLYVNDYLIYNGTYIPDYKTKSVKGDFKVTINNKDFRNQFHIIDSINRVDVYFKDSFLIQYLRQN